MSILKVARMGHPVLREVARGVDSTTVRTPAFQKLIDDMIDTMVEYEGIGLAAPQVHESVRLFVAGVEGSGDDLKIVPFVNPVVTAVGTETAEDWEGCLSIPDLRGRVPRAREIVVRALEIRGRDDAPLDRRVGEQDPAAAVGFVVDAELPVQTREVRLYRVLADVEARGDLADGRGRLEGAVGHARPAQLDEHLAFHAGEVLGRPFEGIGDPPPGLRCVAEHESGPADAHVLAVVQSALPVQSLTVEPGPVARSEITDEPGRADPFEPADAQGRMRSCSCLR